MRSPARFQFDFNPAEVNRQIPPAAMMVDMKDIGFKPGDDGEEAGEAAGNVFEAN